MEYTIQDNKIIITNEDHFNIEHILECGQVFTYKKLPNGSYEVYSKNYYALVNKLPVGYEIITNNSEYFVDYFCLNTSYASIKSKLMQDRALVEPIKAAYGLRILKQDLLEVIIGYIISANNNIERIKKTMAKIREFGQNNGHYYSFPTLNELSKITELQFKQMGAGYRAKYLVDTINMLQSVDLDSTTNLSTQKLKEWLLSLCGVGPKVADCILLYGYNRVESFPVDTWMEKVYIDIFGTKKSRVEMSKDFINRYKELSGYAQQYLFYYKRSLNK